MRLGRVLGCVDKHGLRSKLADVWEGLDGQMLGLDVEHEPSDGRKDLVGETVREQDDAGHDPWQGNRGGRRRYP